MTSHVYFVRAMTTGYIKIGFTENLQRRMMHLQGQSGDHLELLVHACGTREHEQFIHRQFAKARLHGEWFRPVPELMEKIEALRQSLGRERLRSYDCLKHAMFN